MTTQTRRATERSENEALIRNVSDTAAWVAACRAEETSRPDALFRDHLAQTLAGERGRAIAALAPSSRWPLITRTKLIDDLVLAAIAEGSDCGN